MPPFLFLSARWRYAYRAYNSVCSVGRIRRSRHPALRPVALRLPGLQQRVLRRPDKAQPPSGIAPGGATLTGPTTVCAL